MPPPDTEQPLFCLSGTAAELLANAPDPPAPTRKQATAALDRAERLSRLTPSDAVKMGLRASEKKSCAADLAVGGDRVGARFEAAEAAGLEQDATDALDPFFHTTAPVKRGRGNELATGAAVMTPFLDTVRQKPDMLAHAASAERMKLADRADALVTGRGWTLPRRSGPAIHWKRCWPTKWLPATRAQCACWQRRMNSARWLSKFASLTPLPGS